MTDHLKAQWIADLREMVGFLEEHPDLIGEYERVVLCVGYPEPDEGEKLLPLLPERDITNDPARFFGDHHLYLPKKSTRQGVIDDAVEGLQEIRDSLERT